MLLKKGQNGLREKSNRRGIKTYDVDNTMSWMTSSIDISQSDIQRVAFNNPEKSYSYSRRYDTLQPDTKRSTSGSNEISSSRLRRMEDGNYGDMQLR